MTFMQMLTAAEATAPIVIDGGLGTAAEDRGIDLDHDLWSAELIRRSPDTLLAVHADFAVAGARILTTASYQASPLGFARAGIGPDEGRRIIESSVRIARRAADRTAATSGAADRAAVPSGVADRTVAPYGVALVAGSVGPYGAALGDGAEYTGDYRLTPEEYSSFHRPRIAALAEAGADLLAVETQPRLDEIRAIVDLAEQTDQPVWVSVTLQDGTDTTRPISAADDETPGPVHEPTLPDGSSLAELAEVADASPAVQAVGVNCVPPSLVTPALEVLSAHTDLPLTAYPNSGETYDATAMTWRDDGGEAGVGSWPVPAWTRLGAQIIGGCCRVSAADIGVLSRASCPD